MRTSSGTRKYGRKRGDLMTREHLVLVSSFFYFSFDVGKSNRPPAALCNSTRVFARLSYSAHWRFGAVCECYII
jgi:hypothetical protein